MKFAHFSDCHIGGWREPELRKLGIETFRKAIDLCIKEHAGFVLISGDLFDTALPQTELIKETADILKKLQEHDISVYAIPGSHDFSPSGKTMIDVFDKAGLLHNVVKFNENNELEFTEDKTGIKITGLYGKKLGLEKFDYERLKKDNLEKEKGFKIFMFHTALEEFKPADMEKMEAYSYKDLPKNFSYYAGGHVHYIYDTKKEDYGLITFPGPTFPNNFKELEELGCGGFYIVDDKLNLNHIKIKLKEVISLKINVDNMDSDEAGDFIINNIKKNDIKDKILLLRISGVLKSGKPTDIDFKKIINSVKEAYAVLKNTNKLTGKETEINDENNYSSIKDIEDEVIKNNLPGLNIEKNEVEFIKEIIAIFDKEKKEGEKNTDFENRIIKDAEKILEL
ncbi:DNA repair exonuclease [Candidatus Woesearchaeota archaeon]|nr:DNA repair exonuclease [Candidatus Woesearchaeota archaeon]